MTVLNYKNTHFNLIVGPSHMLAQFGSLPFQTATQGEKEVETTNRPVLQEAPEVRQGLNETGHKEKGQDTQEQEFLHFAFTCNVCKKGFTHKGNLFKHKKDHMEPNAPEVQISPRKENTSKHKQFQFSGVKACDKCGSFFLSVDLMTEHQKKYHVESIEIEIDD